MIGARRTLLSVLVGTLLVATAVASLWLMASAGVFTGTESQLPQAPAAGNQGQVTTPAAPVSIPPGQVEQPRDPFEPIVTPPATAAPPTSDGETTTTTGGGGETSTTTSTTAGGSTTSTTTGDAPGTTRITLLEVREENGVRIAVVEVDGETYTVGIGDTFADSFKVIDLTENGGVFTYGDSAFTLSVGQSILK